MKQITCEKRTGALTAASRALSVPSDVVSGVDAQTALPLKRSRHSSFRSNIRGVYANWQIVEGGFDEQRADFVSFKHVFTLFT